MQTSPRRNRLAGFGLIDTLVGLFLLVVTSVLLANGFSTLLVLGQRQDAKAQALVAAADAMEYATWF